MKPLILSTFLQKFFPKFHSKLCVDLSHNQINNILHVAQNQKTMILEEAKEVANEYIQEHLNKLNEFCESAEKEIYSKEQNLLLKEVELAEYDQKIETEETTLDLTNHEVEEFKKILTFKTSQSSTIKNDLSNELQKRAGCEQQEIFDNLKSVHLKTHTYDVSKLSLEKQETLKQNAQKTAQQLLDVVYHRYQPRFVWPKSSFLVNTNQTGLVEKYLAESSPISELLLENTDTNISLLETQIPNQSAVKIVGGLGVDKEIIRLTLEECFNKKLINVDKIRAIKSKHALCLDQLILNMGAQATKILDLQKVHPEILKLIGSLNFRTSHRQNQYYHSLEVAVLSGMIASELGVSSSLAKRAGLLHDIGKVLDYKIEGSHAVISGDYAERYFESTDVVDSVLAHHDDKIVDTPHAFILKAADAMSGARPGARVDTEDGYNRRLDGISAVVDSFKSSGVLESAIMHAGREVHVYVDSKKMSYSDLDPLAKSIAEKLEEDVEYPGQIRVTVIRRMEITQVA